MERPKSVLHGHDSEAIDMLICIHCESEQPDILDVTYNTGKMWKGSVHTPVRSDINHEYDLDYVANFTELSPFGDDSFDVIVFDPPHLPLAAASENSSKIWYDVYGITDDDLMRSGDNVSKMFVPFLSAARRVLRPGGVILAKIADIVHNHKYQWQHVDFIKSAQAMGCTPCDMLIKTSSSSGNLQSSKWKNVYHLRRAHVYWIVVRNAAYDERKKTKKGCMK